MSKELYSIIATLSTQLVELRQEADRCRQEADTLQTELSHSRWRERTLTQTVSGLQGKLSALQAKDNLPLQTYLQTTGKDLWLGKTGTGEGRQQVIKAIRTIASMGLREAKEYAESYFSERVDGSPLPPPASPAS